METIHFDTAVPSASHITPECGIRETIPNSHGTWQRNRLVRIVEKDIESRLDRSADTFTLRPGRFEFAGFNDRNGAAISTTAPLLPRQQTVYCLVPLNQEPLTKPVADTRLARRIGDLPSAVEVLLELISYTRRGQE